MNISRNQPSLKGNPFLNVLRGAREQGIACGAFNFFDYWSALAIIRAAEECGKNVVLQVSTPTVKHYGVKEIAAYVLPLKQSASVQVALHLDHCRDEEIAKECILRGWDAVMMDYSAFPLEQNIENTRRMVLFAHAHHAAVEGEVGRICGVEEDISEDTGMLAGYEETMAFVEATQVDAIAPAIGTAHGVYSGVPKLNYELVKQLGREDCPLVIHGGTGLQPDVFRELVALGAAKINISTAVKASYFRAIRQIAQAEKLSPLQANDRLADEMKDAVKQHIQIFSDRG